MSKKMIIVKYADQHDNWFLSDSIHDSYTAKQIAAFMAISGQVHMVENEPTMPDYFITREVAKQWLKFLIKLNPSVGYGIVVEVEK